MDDYSDIINLPHYVSRKRRRMSLSERAAQFSAFSALTGFDETLDETARLTDFRNAMSEDELAQLNAELQLLLNSEAEQPIVTVIYFQSDSQKDGGAYLTYTGQFRHCDPAEGLLHFTDGTKIPLKQVCKITREEQRDDN